MSIETKLNLTNEKFCQTDGSLLTLSGDTRISSIGTIRYETNQSSAYTSRSLTDVGYVTGLTTQLCTTANNGITKTGCNFYLGGALTGNTFISGNYTLNICGSANLNSNNGYQINCTKILYSPSSDINSIYLGANAGATGNTGNNDIAIGCYTLRKLVFGAGGGHNVAIGSQVLCNSTDGCNNIGIGTSVMAASTTGSYNIGIGNLALSKSCGKHNIGLGISSLFSNTGGECNISLGCEALKSNIFGCQNIGIGSQALYSNCYGNDNLAIGFAAGFSATGNSNVFIGKYAGCAETGSNKLYIGNSQVQTLIYGDFLNNFITLPTLKLCNNPGIGSASDSILVWNSTDKCVKAICGGAVLTSAITGATNGLSKTGQNVKLGGTLTGDTIIYGNSKSLSLGTSDCLMNVLNINSLSTNICPTTILNLYSANISVNNVASYNNNYCCSFTKYSLVDKNYVTGITITTANNGLTKSGVNVRLGGTLTGNTGINGAYSLGFNNSIINLTGSSCINLSGVVKLLNTPGAGTTSDSILVWNSTDKCVKAVSGGAVLTSAITGATNGLSKTGQNVKLGGTLTGDTIIYGTCTLCVTAPSINTDVQYLTFDNNPTTPTTTASLYYKNNSLNFNREFSGVTLQVGEETVVRVSNVTGSLIPNGTVVYICGAVNGIPTIAKSIASNSNSLNTLGLTTMDIDDNNEGYLTLIGQVNAINTSSWAVGSRVYLSSSQAGCLTTTPPSYPNEVIHMGYVTCQNAIGSILVVPDVETPYTSIGTFTGYTASTASALNSKLNTSVFNNYTGATTPVINSLVAMCACAVTGATNGLSKVNVHDVCMGGTISNPVTICGTSSFKIGDTNGITLSTQNGNDIALNSKSCGGVYIKSQSGTSDSSISFTCSVGLQIDYNAVNGFAIYDNRSGVNQTGIVYGSDYSLNYVSRSLVDKAYVDSVATGLDAKTGTLVATTVNITLSGLTTIDGVTLTTGDRILVKDQINGALNGIYSASTGTWGRTSDYNFSPSGEVSNGDLIPVTSGNTNANSVWILTTQNPIISGDTLIYSKFSQQVGVTEGNGINITTVGTNKQISVELSPTACGLQFNGTGLEIDYDIFRLGLCCTTGGYVDVRAIKGVASGNEIPVKINTGGTNSLYVDSTSVISCIGNPVLNANNGLTKTGCNVRLGGSLTGGTTINGNSNALTICCATTLNLGYTSSSTITDGNVTPRGLVYAANYSSTFCNRSLVDKEYVDGLITSGVLACNGLSKVGNTVILGGALTGNTVITYGANRLCFINGDTSCIDIVSDCSQVHVENTSLCLKSCTLGSCIGTVCITNTGIVSLSSNATCCGVRITTPSTGAIYTADYSAGFINESLVTKRYVTGVTNTIASNYVCTANNGLTKSGTNVRLGGALTGNTTITGAYTLNICSDAKLNTACGYQICGNTILRTSPSTITSIFIGCDAGNMSVIGTTGVNNIGIGFQTHFLNTSGNDNIALGFTALRQNVSGCYNIASGCQALYLNTTGNNNIASGAVALYGNTSGCDNIAMGYQSLYCNATGCNNIGSGYGALYINSTGNNNIAISCKALFCNTTASNLIAIGANALYNNRCVNAACNGQYNIAVGHGALSGNTYGCANYAFGYGVLSGNTTGCNNIANGYQSSAKNSIGCNNIANGYQALYSNTGGTNNIANGYQAMYSNISGNNNVGLGYQVLWKNTIGYRNISIGSQSMYNNTTGCNNIGFGFCSLYANNTGCHNIAINCLALGSNSTGCINIGIGTFALLGNTSGCHNIGMGHYAGYSNSTGSYNMYFGTCAGYSETGSGKLFVATGATRNLIYGDFSSNEITLPKLKLCETPATGCLTDNVLVWNSTDKCVKTVSTYGLFGICSVTGVSTNATLSADNQVVLVDTTSGSVTITLPTAATIVNGKVYMIKNTACGLINNVIIDSGLNSIIDGSRCAVINTNYGALQLIRACTAGSNSVWYTLSFNN